MIIIKSETKLISSINNPHSMKGKPLINEANLQKISKTQQFLIRSKPSLPKTMRQQKSSKNIEAPDIFHTDLQHCIELLDEAIREDKSLLKDQNQALLRLLFQVKSRCSFLDTSGNEQEFEQNCSFVLRNSQSKYLLKQKNDTHQQRLQLCTSNQKSQGPLDLGKHRPIKLKIGKQNVGKSGVFWEIKAQKLQTKVADQQKLIEQLEDKIKSLSNQLKELADKKEAALAERERLSSINSDLHEKLSLAMLEKVQIKSEMVAIEAQSDQKVQKLGQNLRLLGQKLKQRQQEIVALFQCRANDYLF